MKANTETLLEFGLNSHERIERAIAALQDGKPILLVDDENRENEGDLIVAAEKLTAESMNFLIRNGSGIVCLSLTAEQTERLKLPLMVPEKNEHKQFVAAFTVSIEASHGVTTGVSAADRTRTIHAAINEHAKPSDVARPGHVFPVRAQANGVFSRPGHTEGSIDLMRIAGLKPAGVICELMNPDGTMSRLTEVIQFARQHGLVVLSIPDIIYYRQNSILPLSQEQAA
ncbi:MAG: 3,4-dihydroxy-2-butanone-4-phosphate synthase [bacterium]|nr:3,4-dihydroxy-2-butanone-4-phosphate synthase [bacterium]